jgi:hypothetical protein
MIRVSAFGVCVTALVLAFGVGPVLAQEGVSGSNDVVPVPATVSGSEVTPGSGDTVDVSTEQADASDPDGSLPFTGGDAITLVVIAMAALGIGGLLLLGSRRRADQQLTAGHLGD